MKRYAVRMIKTIDVVVWLEANEPLLDEDIHDEAQNALFHHLNDEEVYLKNVLSTDVIKITEENE
jgi:hypothetical protein